MSVNGAYAGFKGQGNVGTGTVLVDQTFNGTIVDYAFVKESATPDVIETYSNGGAGRLTFGSYLPRAGSTLANNSDMKLWTVNDPGSPAYSNPANFTSNTSVGAFDNINGSIDISGITVGSVYFFYSGYRTMPFFSATMKDTEALVADVPLPVFGDGDTANSTEHYVCSLNFVNNNGLDTIDWSLTSNLYNGEPLCSLRGIVLVTSTGQIAMIPNVVGLTQTAAQNSIKSAGFSVGSVLLRSSSTVPTGTVISQSPGNGSTAIKTSAVNLVVSNGLPTTPVPNVIGLEQSIAESHIVAEGLVVGNVTTEASTTVSPGDVISQSPNSGSLLVFGGSVNLVVAGNSPPVANNGSATVDEDGSVAITLTATDSDAGASLTYSVVAGPTNGALSGTAPNLTYTPNANYNGSDSFTFKANDGTVDSNVASISITVNAVNDTPVWAGNPIVGSDATKDVPYSGTLAGEASDVDTSDSLTFALVGAQGWLSVAPDGTLSGTPTSADVGPNTFTVSVTDGVIGTPVQTTLDITVNPPTGANLLAYEGFDYPVGELLGLNGGQGFASGWADSGGTSTQGYVRDETTNVFFDNTTLNWDGVLNNGFPTSPGTGSRYMASDAQIGSNVDVKRTLAASAGAMAGADGVLWMSAVYRFPNGNSGAGINFGFTDGGHLTDRGRRTSSTTMDFIGVSGWNGTSAWSQQLNPTIIDSTTATNYIWNQFARTAGGVNMSSTVDKIIVLKFSFGASDKVEAFWFDENTALASMTEEAFNAGKIGATYAAGINENNLNTLVYSQGRFDNAIDEIRIGDSFAVVAGQNAPQNTAPTWATNPVNEADANEDAAYSATLADNAGDADAGDTLTFAKVSGPAWLDVAANGTLSGTPSNADVGANVFTVSVTDNNSSAVEATLNITVNPVNDAPVASNGSATTSEDTAVGITLVATDIDSTIQSYTIVTAPTKGTLSGIAPEPDLHAGCQRQRRGQLHLHGQRRHGGFQPSNGEPHGDRGQRRAGGLQWLGDHQRGHGG